MSTQAPVAVAMVVARPSSDPRKWGTAVDEAIDAERSSIRALENAIADAGHGGPRRATISKVARFPHYGIRKDYAENLATALGRPVGELFMHKDGAPLNTA